MSSHLLQYPKRLLGYASVFSKVARHSFSKVRLPPGKLSNLYKEECKDQRYLLKQTATCGPIFRLRSGGQLTICIVGLKRCRQLLQIHRDHIESVTIDLASLFPNGFLRQMKGNTHRHYRAILIQGIHEDAVDSHSELYQSVIQEHLQHYQKSAESKDPNAFKSSLESITESILHHLIFGVQPHSEDGESLKSIFLRIRNDYDHTYNTPEQKAAYLDLRSTLMDHKPGPDCILGRLQASNDVDETVMGNLIFMAETGRYDLYRLLRWVSKYAADFPDLCNQIATEPIEWSEAFVRETLRHNQIERLLRRTTRAFEFEGFLFPKSTLVRLCLWESHKDPIEFPEPFQFDPKRQLGNPRTLDAFAPFGLGHHRCPFSGISVHIAKRFLKTMVQGYRVEGIGNGPPERGRAHYEPAKSFTVVLHKKSNRL